MRARLRMDHPAGLLERDGDFLYLRLDTANRPLTNLLTIGTVGGNPRIDLDPTSGNAITIQRDDSAPFTIFYSISRYLSLAHIFEITSEGLNADFRIGSATTTSVAIKYNDVVVLRVTSQNVHIIGNLQVDGTVSSLVSKLDTVAPTVNDDSASGFQVGSRWLDTVAKRDYVAISVGVGAADWQESSGAGSGVTRAYVPAAITTVIPDRHQILVSGLYEIEATGFLDIESGGKLVLLQEAA